MTTIHVQRLNLDVRGVDAAVVRAALDQLPARLSAALLTDRADPRPHHDTGLDLLRVPPATDAATLATAMARHVAAAVRRQTPGRPSTQVTTVSAQDGQGE